MSTAVLVWDVKTNRSETRLRNVAANVQDLRPVWFKVEDDFKNQNRKTFATQGRGTWPPLTTRYARVKARKYPGAPMLYRTGRLESSLTTSLDISNIQPHSMIIGSTSDIGNYHKKGAKRRRGGLLRRRRPVILPKTWRARQRSRVRKFILTGVP